MHRRPFGTRLDSERGDADCYRQHRRRAECAESRGVYQSLGTAAKLSDGAIGSVTLPGSDEKPNWSQTADALTIDAPKSVPNDIAVVFKVTCRD